MTGGQLIVECLVRHGVDMVFGIPGAHTISIYDALHRHPKIRHVLVRHEQSAALMADGYARSTGRLGVCCVTTGPGVTNAATGLAVANNDSIPVLLISSQVHSEAAKKRRGLFHAMDQLALTKPITKWNARIDRPEQIPQVMANAFGVLIHHSLPTIPGSARDRTRVHSSYAFALQDPGFLGTSGRNYLTGPGYSNLDFSLGKKCRSRNSAIVEPWISAENSSTFSITRTSL